MRSRTELVIILAVALVVAFTVASSPESGSEKQVLERVGLEVSIGLDDSSASIYRCKAVITDLESNEILASPTVRFPAGDQGQIRAGTAPGLDVHIIVSVNEEETEAKYSASIYRNEDLVSSQNVRIALGKS